MSPGYTAIDSGFGYTYLNPQTGHELSAVAGFTYSGMNDALQYRNGIDFHFDWAMSQFVSKSVHVGLAGYAYQQITGDSGAGARLGEFKGHSVGIGPQIGIFFPAWKVHGLSEHPRLLGRHRREPADDTDRHGHAELCAGRTRKTGDAARAAASQIDRPQVLAITVTLHLTRT